MKLSNYLSQERGRQASLAKAIGAHAPDVSRWAEGKRPIPDHYGVAIEKATNGLVTRREMFPDTWQRWWPELATEADAQQAWATEPSLIPGAPIDDKKLREARNGMRAAAPNTKPMHDV